MRAMTFGKNVNAIRFAAAFLAAGQVAVPQNMVPQEVAPLPVEAVLRMKYLGASSREFSSDGKWFAYAVTASNTEGPQQGGLEAYLRTGIPLIDRGSDIWIANVETLKVRNLTDGKGNNRSPSWSPDGHSLAFLSDRDGGSQAQLWLWDSINGSLRRISRLPIRLAATEKIQWTPDGKKIIVTVAPAGKPPAGQPKNATSTDPGELPGAGPVDGSTAIVYRAMQTGDTASPSSDPLSSDEQVRDLVEIDVAGGESQILVHDRRIGYFEIFKDGSRLAFASRERFEAAGSQQTLHELWVVNLLTGDQRLLVSGVRMDLWGYFSISPNGLYLALRSRESQEKPFDVFTVDVKHGGMRNVSRFEKAPDDTSAVGKSKWDSYCTPLWDPKGMNVYFVRGGSLWRSAVLEGNSKEVARFEGSSIRQLVAEADSILAIYPDGKSTAVIVRSFAQKRDVIYKIDLNSGTVARVLDQEACHTCEAGARGHLAALAPNGRRFAYSSQDAQHPGDIWLTDEEFKNPAQLTHLNPQLERYQMGSARLIDWLDDDGQRLHGALILPSNYREGIRYPMVVLVYGGATSSDSLETFGGRQRGMPWMNLQLLASRGYAVLMPDAPQHMGTPMLDLAKTVLPGVNRVVDMGIADPDRLGVMGHSYGGYSTLSLMVQTKRFKAAVATDGMADLIGLYGEMDRNGVAFGTSSETGQELVGGNPWQHRDRYVENSPAFYLDRIETPLLLAHGTEDSTFASFLGDQVFVGLRRLGRVVEYVKYEGEDHILIAYSNKLDFANRMISWFGRYLRAGAS